MVSLPISNNIGSYASDCGSNEEEFKSLEKSPKNIGFEAQPEVKPLNSSEEKAASTGRIQNLVDRVRNIEIPKVPRRVEYAASATANVVKKTVNITTAILEVFNLVIRTAHSITKAVSGFFKDSKFVQNAVKLLEPIFKYASIGQIVLAPLHLYQFSHGIYDVIKGEIDPFDFILNSVESLSLIVDSMVTLLNDLSAVAVIPMEVIKFLWPFDIIGIVLSAVSLISAARGWHHAAGFSKDFSKVIDADKQASEFSQKDYMAVIQFIQRQDPRRLKRITGGSGNDLIDRVVQVSTKALREDQEGVEEDKRVAAKQAFGDAMKALKGRVKTKIISSQLSVATSSISLIANSTLFITPFLMPVCPVLAPVSGLISAGCYTLKGATGCVSLSNFIYKMVTGSKFDKSELMKMTVEKKDDESAVIPVESSGSKTDLEQEEPS
ncbi:MAG: hypothetical protein VX777_04730 [Chlamydiota bacterium]|nr:hypothetical protein [Chlamydiota bacterium]